MQFGLSHVFIRWCLCMGIVLGTYNPTARSFWPWVIEASVPLSLKVLLGTLLVAAFAMLILTTLRAIGRIGVLILLVLVVSGGAVITDLGLIDLGLPGARMVLAETLLASFLTLGLCWSAIRTRLSGQVNSFDVSRRV